MLSAEFSVGVNAFTRSRDVIIMDFLRNAYLNAFSNQAILEQHKAVPPLLDISIQPKKNWIMPDKHYGIMPRVVRRQDLLPAASLISLATADSITLTHTFAIIDKLQYYVKAREGSFVYRRGWSAYSNLVDPRYYLITFLQERLLFLATVSHKRQDAINEIYCLREFVFNIFNDYTRHFPRSISLKFYRLMKGVIYDLQVIKDLLDSDQSRPSLSPTLTDISRTVKNMRYFIDGLLIDLRCAQKLSEQVVWSTAKNIESDITAKDYATRLARLMQLNTDLDEYQLLIQDLASFIEHAGLQAVSNSGLLRQLLHNIFLMSSDIKIQLISQSEAMVTLLLLSKDQGDLGESIGNMNKRINELKVFFQNLERKKEETQPSLLNLCDSKLSYTADALPNAIIVRFRQLVSRLESNQTLSSEQRDRLLINIPVSDELLVAKAIPVDAVGAPVKVVSVKGAPSVSKAPAEPDPIKLLNTQFSNEKEQLGDVIRYLEQKLARWVEEALWLLDAERFEQYHQEQVEALLKRIRTTSYEVSYHDLDLGNMADWEKLHEQLGEFQKTALERFKKKFPEHADPDTQARLRRHSDETFGELKERIHDFLQQRQKIISRLGCCPVEHSLRQLKTWREQHISAHGMRVMTLAQRLVTEQDLESYRQLLAEWVRLLASPSYQLCFQRGTDYRSPHHVVVQLPRHVVAMLNHYHAAIGQATELLQLQMITCQMLVNARQAAERKRWHIGHWFGTRHRSTQCLYTALGTVATQFEGMLQSKQPQIY